ncbi:(2Fe-2S)-binding protein [bacterium]|nr:(2Fe-2S)-binding protein [bacterium]
MKRLIILNINGENYEIAVKDNRTLLEAIREECNLTGTKQGCDVGDCGSCMVLLDGVPVQSCLTLAVACTDKKITTVEGIAENGKPHPIQKAFDTCGGEQCGFCTPGFLISSKHLLDCNTNPSLDEIKNSLSGNLCRCTGYTKIIEAVQVAAKELRTLQD